MKVITLDKSNFISACNRLARNVLDTFETPDIVIGIATGGAIVGQYIHQVTGGELVIIKIQRPSTQRKENKFIRKILQILPMCILDQMRKLESSILKFKKAIPAKAVLPDELKKRLYSGNIKRILIVDDAIDSGSTMAGVYEAIKECTLTAQIHTAAITLTTSNPLIYPDTTLYTSTLIRFPWSKDYRN